MSPAAATRSARRRSRLVGLAAAIGGVLAAGAPTALHAQSAPLQGPIVYVVAPSPSTSREARRIMRFCRWNDTTAVRDADMVLVVVRSSGSSPMAPSYDSMKWLRDVANSQLNESGPLFHAYLYLMGQDQSLVEANHRSYNVADGSGRLFDPWIQFSGCGFPCACF